MATDESAASVVLSHVRETDGRTCPWACGLDGEHVAKDCTWALDLDLPGPLRMEPVPGPGEQFLGWREDPEVGRCPARCLNLNASIVSGVPASLFSCPLSASDVGTEKELEEGEPIYCLAEFSAATKCSFGGVIEDPVWQNVPDEMRVTVSGFGGSSPECAPVNGTYIASYEHTPLIPFVGPQCSWRVPLDLPSLPYRELIIGPLPSGDPEDGRLALLVYLVGSEGANVFPSIWSGGEDGPPFAFGAAFDFAMLSPQTMTREGTSPAPPLQCAFVEETTTLHIEF